MFAVGTELGETLVFGQVFDSDMTIRGLAIGLEFAPWGLCCLGLIARFCW
jgi:hypothetical protein